MAAMGIGNALAVLIAVALCVIMWMISNPKGSKAASDSTNETSENALKEETAAAVSSDAHNDLTDDVGTEEAPAEQEQPAPAEDAEQVNAQPEAAEETEAGEETVIAETAAEKPAEPEEQTQTDVAVVAVQCAEEDDEEDEEETEDEAEEAEDFAAMEAEDETEILSPEDEAAVAAAAGIALAEVMPEQPVSPFNFIYRYNFSFRAKLIQSPPDQQRRYGELMDVIRSFPKLKTNKSWKQERVYVGRKTVAMMFFRGRKLCIAFALDPEEWAGTKYRGIDLREVKRFAKTPMALKLRSERKVKYAKHLLCETAKRNGLTQGALTAEQFSLPYRTTEELIAAGLVKLVNAQPAEIAAAETEPEPVVRESVSAAEAKVLMADDAAKHILEDMTAEAVAEGETQSVPRVSSTRVRGSLRAAVNIDTLSANYHAGETVTLKTLKEKKLIPQKAEYVKVLARGTLDKPLVVEVNDFSVDAVKMIVLVGGKAILV